MKDIQVMWFKDTIGIVLGKDEYTGKYKSYIGNGSGYNEGEDKHYIASHGGKFLVEAALKLFNIKEV